MFSAGLRAHPSNVGVLRDEEDAAAQGPEQARVQQMQEMQQMRSQFEQMIQQQVAGQRDENLRMREMLSQNLNQQVPHGLTMLSAGTLTFDACICFCI